MDQRAMWRIEFDPPFSTSILDERRKQRHKNRIHHEGTKDTKGFEYFNF